MFVSNRMAIFHQGSVTESFPVVRSGYYSDSILIKDTGKSFNNDYLFGIIVDLFDQFMVTNDFTFPYFPSSIHFLLLLT